jgi:hypothetical protein
MSCSDKPRFPQSRICLLIPRKKKRKKNINIRPNNASQRELKRDVLFKMNKAITKTNHTKKHRTWWAKHYWVIAGFVPLRKFSDGKRTHTASAAAVLARPHQARQARLSKGV